MPELILPSDFLSSSLPVGLRLCVIIWRVGVLLLLVLLLLLLLLLLLATVLLLLLN